MEKHVATIPIIVEVAVKISLVVPITRWWALNQLFNCLNRIETNEYFGGFTERIFYIDTDDLRTIEGVKNYADDNDKIIISGNPEPSSVRITERRNRITTMRNETRKLVDGTTDYVISIEDDTIIPSDAIIKLTDMARKNTDLGIGSGVQVGRWKAKMIGIWKVDDVENPTKYITLPNTPYDYIEEIDATGMFCYITPTPLYKEMEYYWENPTGPDVAYGLELRRRGYKNIVDWSLVCGHNDFGKVLYPDGECVQILFEKEGDKWVQTIK